MSPDETLQLPSNRRNPAYQKTCLGGRFTMRTCILFWFTALILVLLTSLLCAIFLHIVPEGIQRRYKSGFQLSNLKMSEWTFFPDQKNHGSVTVEGTFIHPTPFWGYKGHFHTWTFFNEMGHPIFNAQPIHESVLPENPLKSKFRSKMKLQFSNTSANVVQLIDDVLNVFLYPNLNSKIPNSLWRLRMNGAFSLGGVNIFQNISIDFSFPEIQKAIVKNTGAGLNKKTVAKRGFMLNQLNMRAIESGIQFEIYHSTKEFLHNFRFPKGIYPIYMGKFLVAVLKAKKDIQIQGNEPNGLTILDLQFISPFDESGSLLFSAMPLALISGRLSLKLKGPTLNEGRSWTLYDKNESRWPELEFPSFKKHIILFQKAFSQRKTRFQKLIVNGNQINVFVELDIPNLTELDAFYADFGVKFKISLNELQVFEFSLSHVAMYKIRPELLSIRMRLAIKIAQGDKVTETLLKMYRLLEDPDFFFHVGVKEILFFPFKPSTLACHWCEALFSKVDFAAPVPADTVKSKLLELLAFLENDLNGRPGKVKVSDFWLSNKKQLDTFSSRFLVDLSALKLDIKEIDIPTTRITWEYQGAVLGIFSLPKGLHCVSCATSPFQLYLDFQVSTHVQVQPHFRDLLYFIVKQQLAVIPPMRLAGLSIGKAPSSLETFRLFSFRITPHRIYQWIQTRVGMSLLEKLKLISVMPTALHLNLVNGQRLLVATDFQVWPPIPITLDMTAISFSAGIQDVFEVWIMIPDIKVRRGDQMVRVKGLEIQIKNLFYPKVLALHSLDSMSLISPHLSVQSIQFHSSKDQKPVSTLDSFILMNYKFGPRSLYSLNNALDFSYLMMLLEEMTVLSSTFNAIKKDDERNLFSTEIEIEYVLDNKFYMEVMFLSFDLFIEGTKRCLVQVHVQQSRTIERNKLNLQLNIQLYQGPLVEAQECKTQSSELPSVCIKDLSIGKDKSSQRPFLPASIFLNDVTILRAVTFLHSFLQKTEFHLNNLFISELSVVWELIYHLAVKKPTPEVGAIRLSSVAFVLEKNVLQVDSKLEMPQFVLDLWNLNPTFVLSYGHIGFLKANLYVLKYQALAETNHLHLRLDIEFLDLNAVQNNGRGISNLNLLNKRDSPAHERVHSAVPQFNWSLPISATLLEVNNTGVVGTLLSRMKNRNVQIFDSSVVMLAALLNSLEGNLDKNELWGTRLLNSLSQIHFNQSEFRLDGLIVSALVFALEFNFSDTFWLPFPVSIEIVDSAVDILVDKIKVGALDFSISFNGQNVNHPIHKMGIRYHAESATEAKSAFSKLMDSLLSDEESALKWNVCNVRFHTLQPSPLTILSYIDYAPKSNFFKNILLNFATPQPESMQEPLQHDANGQSDLKKLTSPKKMGPKVSFNDMFFLFETDSGFSIGIGAQFFLWDNRRINVQDATFLVEDIKKENSIWDRMRETFEVFNLRIGKDAKALSEDESHIIDWFSLLRINRYLLGRFLPVERVSNLKRALYSLLLDKININQNLPSEYILELRTILKLKSGTASHLPSIRIDAPIDPHFNTHVEIRNTLTTTSESGLEVVAQIKKCVFGAICDSPPRTLKPQLNRFILFSIDLNDVVPTSLQPLNVHADNVHFFIDPDIQTMLFDRFFYYAIKLMRENVRNVKTSTAPGDPNFFNVQHNHDPVEGYAMFDIGLKLPGLFNLHLNLNSLRIQVFNTKELSQEKKIIYTFELLSMEIFTTHTLNLKLQAYVGHSLGALNEYLDGSEKWEEDVSYIVDIASRGSEYRLSLPRLVEVRPKLAEYLTLFYSCFDEHIMNLTSLFLRWTYSQYTLENVAVRLLGTNSMVGLQTRISIQSPRADEGYIPGDYFLQMRMRNVSFTVNNTKVEPQSFVFDGETGLEVSVHAEVPTSTPRGHLSHLVRNFLPENIQLEFENIEYEDEETTEETTEEESEEESQEENDDENGGENEDKNEDENENKNENENENKNENENENKDEDEKHQKKRDNCSEYAFPRVCSKGTSIPSIPFVVNDISLGNQQLIPLNVSFSVRKDTMDSLTAAMPGLDSIAFNRIHLYFTDSSMVLNFSGEIDSRVNIEAFEHAIKLCISMEDDHIADLVMERFQLKHGAFSGVMYISIPPNTTFLQFSNFPDMKTLGLINIHHLQLYSVLPSQGPIRMLFSQRFYAPISEDLLADLKFSKIYDYVISETSFLVPINMTLLIDLPYFEFESAYRHKIGLVKIENTRIHVDKRPLCIVTNAENYFIENSYRKMFVMAVWDSNIKTYNIRFGKNGSLISLKNYTHRFEAKAIPVILTMFKKENVCNPDIYFEFKNKDAA